MPRVSVYITHTHTGALCNQGGKWEYQWALASANAAEVQQQQQLQQQSKELKKVSTTQQATTNVWKRAPTSIGELFLLGLNSGGGY